MQSLSDYPEKLNSLGEVQRIIGLSLSKIQLGRNQRGGLPLHKNLLVATVLNKARDLYMQETMYMNYKMMTGHQFGMVTAGGSDLTAAGSIRPSEEEMDDPPENEDYEEDSESDVEDDCETRSCELAASSRCQPHKTFLFSLSLLTPQQPNKLECLSLASFFGLVNYLLTRLGDCTWSGAGPGLTGNNYYKLD